MSKILGWRRSHYGRSRSERSLTSFGIGYTWESGIHVHLERATLDRSLLGSPAAQRRRLATLLVERTGTGS